MDQTVVYDRGAKIAAVGPSVWGKLGPERWFDDYKIICADSRGFAAGYLVDLHLSFAGAPYTTQDIVNTTQFQELATGPMADYRFITYEAVRPPTGMSVSRFVTTGMEFKKFEDKRVFRELFTGKIAIPKYEVISFADLRSQDAKELYDHLSAKLGKTFVLQEHHSAGGRGTFFVRASNDLTRALESLEDEHRVGVCILSEFIPGVERSMQACVLSAGIEYGPLQEQLLRNPELLDMSSRGGMYFCGGRLADEDTSDPTNKKIRQAMSVIGNELQKAGYRGLYGADFLVDKGGTPYAIEINARPTGIQPLLKEQSGGVSLYLLHILELSGEQYKITASSSAETSGPQSFVIFFNKQPTAAHFDSAITTGNYQLKEQGFTKIDGEPHWNPNADFMLQLFCSPTFPAGSGLKLCNIFLKGSGFTSAGELTEEAEHVVELLKEHVVAAGHGL